MSADDDHELAEFLRTYREEVKNGEEIIRKMREALELLYPYLWIEFLCDKIEVEI